MQRLFADPVFRLILDSTHDGVQAYNSLRHYTVATYYTSDIVAVNHCRQNDVIVTPCTYVIFSSRNTYVVPITSQRQLNFLYTFPYRSISAFRCFIVSTPAFSTVLNSTPVVFLMHSRIFSRPQTPPTSNHCVSVEDA